MTPSKSDVEQKSQANNDALQARANSAQDTVIGNNSQLNGKVQDTGYYKNEVGSGTAATTEGFDASARNLKASMEAAGVSGRSGVNAGATTAEGVQEAEALGKIRSNAYADTEAQQLAANGQDIAIAGQEQGGATNYNDEANKSEMQRQQIGASNWQALGQAVSSAASPWSAGLSKKTLGG